MPSWPKRIVILFAGLSLAGCAVGDRGHTWRGTRARPRVRAYCTPPAAPEFVPAGIDKPSSLPVTPAAPSPIPQNIPSEPTIAPEAPLETTSGQFPWEEPFAPPMPPADPSTNWDLTPIHEEAPFEFTPRTRRSSDRPTSTRKEEKSAVEELGEGPIARHPRATELPLSVARNIPRGHTSAPAIDARPLVVQSSPSM